MKRTPRLLKLAAVFAVGTAVASFPGCSAGGPKIDLTHHQPVPIVVAYDDAAGKIGPVIPEPVPLWEQYQYPIWYLIGAPDCSKILIRFKKEDPLEPEERETAAAAPKMDKTGRCEVPTFRRGVPKKGTAGKTFEYTIIVMLPGGTKTILDPKMQIWP